MEQPAKIVNQWRKDQKYCNFSAGIVLVKGHFIKSVALQLFKVTIDDSEQYRIDLMVKL